MLFRKSVKIFAVFVVFIALLPSCRWLKSLTGSPTPTPTPFTAQEIPSDIPFQTKEPENYQANFIISTFSGDEKSTKKTFIARNGIKYFTTFNAGEKSAFSSLRLENGVFYLISDEKKIFTEETLSSHSGEEKEDSLPNFLMTEWLNGKTSVKFEELKTENNLTAFRTDLDSTRNTEVLLYIDRNLNFPVKQEFYSFKDGQKKLVFSAEISDFQPQSNEKYFEIPAGYKKVSRQEFDKIIYQD